MNSMRWHWGDELTNAEVHQEMNRDCKICSFLGGKCLYQINLYPSACHSTSAGISPDLVYKATLHSRRISRISTQMQRFHPTINLKDTLA
jgi:hypothetical protein